MSCVNLNINRSVNVKVGPRRSEQIAEQAGGGEIEDKVRIDNRHDQNRPRVVRQQLPRGC